MFRGGAQPTTVFQQWIAQMTYPYLTPQLVVALPTPNVSSLVDLHWQGDSPLFRGQHCEDLCGSLWQSEEVTFQTNTTVAPEAPLGFFRILNSGQ